jgi:hypothetical protein
VAQLLSGSNPGGHLALCCYLAIRVIRNDQLVTTECRPRESARSASSRDPRSSATFVGVPVLLPDKRGPLKLDVPEPAQLPDEFVGKPDLLVRDLPVGSSGWIWFNDLYVDQDQKCWVRGKGKVYEKADFTKILVQHTEQGFAITLSRDFKKDFKPDKISMVIRLHEDLRPVVRIATVDKFTE